MVVSVIDDGQLSGPTIFHNDPHKNQVLISSGRHAETSSEVILSIISRGTRLEPKPDTEYVTHQQHNKHYISPSPELHHSIH